MIEKIKRAFGIIMGFLKRALIERCERIIRFVRDVFIEYPEQKERNRRLIILFASIAILDYVMFCLHTDKNVADIFPSLPLLSSERDVTVFLPSPDGVNLITEQRTVPRYGSDEKTAGALFNIVVRGSRYDNTSMAVPAELFLRRVWMLRERSAESLCVFDVEPTMLPRDAKVAANSEGLFKKALEKTIISNIPTVKKVLVMEKGIPGTVLWEW